MRNIVGPSLIFVCMATLSYAAPTLGPAMPRQKEVFMGVQDYSVFNRTLEEQYGKMRSQQEFALFSYGVLDWLSLDLKGGAGSVRQRGGPVGNIKYTTYLAGGYGFRLKFYDAHNSKLIGGFQHISVHPYDYKSFHGSKNKVVLDDWQFPLLLAHDFTCVRPYVGVRWSWMNQIHWKDDVRKLEKSKGTGLIVGTDIPLSKRVWINLEGQFFDTTAASGSLNFSF